MPRATRQPVTPAPADRAERADDSDLIAAIRETVDRNGNINALDLGDIIERAIWQEGRGYKRVGRALADVLFDVTR